MIEFSLTSMYLYVRMAERSKAPHLRCYLLLSWLGFWSPHGGVGSNPTSDNVFFTIGSVVETAHIIFFSVYYASDQCQ